MAKQNQYMAALETSEDRENIGCPERYTQHGEGRWLE
jgi:hypothetical protein